jgi:glucose/arabinose dehydrogenase
MKNGFVIVVVAILIIFGVVYFQKNLVSDTLFLQGNQVSTDGSEVPSVDNQTVFATGLDVPWALAFLPDGRVLVTERLGKVQLIGKDGSKLGVVADIKVDRVPQSEGGLLGIAVHPEFEKNNYVYLYYTYRTNVVNTLNRVVRMKWNGDRLVGEEVIVDNIPGAIFHNGGRIKFGPDKLLYITTGDAQDPSKAQDKNSLAGKILRTTEDGKVVSDNPLGNLIYSYGHRNSQGLAWDMNGKLWVTEHGRSSPTGYDEINLIEKGANYGWDTIQGDESNPTMKTPIRHSGESMAWAPGGAVFVDDSLFFVGLKGEALYEAVISQDRVVELKEHLKGQYGRLREVVLGIDKNLYITTSNRDGRGKERDADDKIIRVNPKAL